jgi:hypothetical protein
MNAESIAQLLNARPVGRGRWQAKCPSHDDRHPSLSISQGHSGLLLRCWSHGCSVEQIVTALGLSMRDLFDAPLTPATRRELELRRAKQELEDSRQRRKRIALMQGYRACTRRMAEIADAVFNGEPEKPDELGREYHDCIDFQRAVEMEVFS